MNRALALPVLALALNRAACPAEQTAQPPGSPTSTPKTEQQRIKDAGHFDVGVFTAAPPAVSGRVNSAMLIGVEVSARPLVMECLVDPKNRGPEKRTKVVIDAALAEAGVDHKVTGENVTPAGVACIDAAMKRWTQQIPALVAKNADEAGVKAHLEIEHIVGTHPAVVMGLNDASDIAGVVRLAVPTWGECFAEWKAAPPRSLLATLKVARPKEKAGPTVAASEVKMDPSPDAVATKVAGCMEGKLKALQFKTPPGDSVTMPYTFRFVHSGITVALPDAAPELQFTELDLQRARRAAEAAVASGERNVASNAYDAVVKRYKEKATPAPTIADLKNGCAAVLAADDKLLAAVEKQGGVDEATRKLAADQTAKDPSWAEAEKAAAATLAQTQKDIASFKALRTQDEGRCPKIKD